MCWGWNSGTSTLLTPKSLGLEFKTVLYQLKAGQRGCFCKVLAKIYRVHFGSQDACLPCACVPGDRLAPGWDYSSGPHTDWANVLPLSYIPSPAPSLLILWVRAMGPERSCQIKQTRKSETSEPRGNFTLRWLYLFSFPKQSKNLGHGSSGLSPPRLSCIQLENSKVLSFTLWQWVSLTPPKLQFDPKTAMARAHPLPTSSARLPFPLLVLPSIRCHWE